MFFATMKEKVMVFNPFAHVPANGILCESLTETRSFTKPFQARTGYLIVGIDDKMF